MVVGAEILELLVLVVYYAAGAWLKGFSVKTQQSPPIPPPILPAKIQQSQPSHSNPT
ncbi:unnamed protein product, partial [Prunus brigantina]